MTHTELRKSFRRFFESKNHKWVESASLLPTDPSVLFTTAGMQQFKPYYTGQADPVKDFGSLNTVSIQKSMRTSCIDEVGDDTHLTLFEMLGNFSFGGYWKKEAVELAHEFITKEMGLTIDYVSVFGGEGKVLGDEESEQIWKSTDPSLEVKKFGLEDNFWGPTGNDGPCGPSTEIYVNGVEIWNIVFNEFYYSGSREELLSGTSSKKLEKLKTFGIDTGMGLERLATVVQKKSNIFETDLLQPIAVLTPPEFNARVKRIITDHSRSISFLITDGVRPSNKEQGYILRRLMRRIITYFYAPPVDNRQSSPRVGDAPLREHGVSFIHGSDITITHDIFAKIVEMYGSIYPELNADMIIHEFDREKEKFEKTLAQGMKELEKMTSVNAESAFKLYESFGLPYEVVKELGGDKAKDLNEEAFDEEFKKHQEISRAGAEKKFGGHGLLLDTGELNLLRSDLNKEELGKATRLHTATHLLHAALKKLLGEEVKQQGSDITPERLRFDFTFHRKLTPEELKQVEDLANDVIKKELPVTKTEMSYEDAIKSGALAFFKQKYPERVNVYSIGDFSKEFCGGPHVSNTREIGKFRVVKEESISAGVRRIRAVVE